MSTSMFPAATSAATFATRKRAVADEVKVPAGYQLVWSGQYEYMQRVRERLKLVVPITLFIVFLLLYFNTGSAVKTFIILLAVPFSAIGAIWFLYCCTTT